MLIGVIAEGLLLPDTILVEAAAATDFVFDASRGEFLIEAPANAVDLVAGVVVGSSVAVAETVTATATQDADTVSRLDEATTADSVQDATVVGLVISREAMLPGVFVNSDTSREANAAGIMVNI